MLNVCICDDDPRDMAQIQALAESFAGEHPEFPMKLQTFPSAFDLLEHLNGKGGFDLYLLDILMPHLKGVELAEHIRARNEAAEILFRLSGIRPGRLQCGGLRVSAQAGEQGKV